MASAIYLQAKAATPIAAKLTVRGNRGARGSRAQQAVEAELQ